MRIERLVNKRDYAVSEIEEKLRQDGYGTSAREQAIARALDANILNDQRYASVFIRTKISSGWGAMRIERELRRRGIELKSVDGWPEEFFDDDQDEESRAYDLARTRRIAAKNGFEKLVRFLCSKGYSLSTSMRVARRVMDECDSE
ncbi:MAG: regulatory protein RecX [Atopobiaceae bacterium]|nr:regulatory protein RecX [Atopobiaceae bacterium]